MKKQFKKKYQVTIEISQSEKPDDRIKAIVNSITPVYNQIFKDAVLVAIDSVPLPEKPTERVQMTGKLIHPLINQLINDAMQVAIGTWPTPEQPGSVRFSKA